MTTPKSSTPEKHAEELLMEFLSVSHVCITSDLEKLTAAHPRDAQELRNLFAVEEQLRKDLSVFGRLRRESERSAYPEGARANDVIGDFRLISRIASGGQGEVWEALELSIGRRVAFKLVLPGRINKKTLAQFAREARAGGRLDHPGIVTVFGYGEDDGRHWISQELVEGGWTLRDFIEEIRNEKQFPEDYFRAVATFTAELADALHAAHEAGVIHRDVKPRNVLVTQNDHPKLTDFGLARITDEVAMSMTGDFAGTWLYMSPEQVTAKRIDLDHRTDIFSLGVVMYEMLALIRPFDGESMHQIAEKIIYAEPPDLNKAGSQVPRDLETICTKALAKRKDDRYSTASDFATDIRRHLAGEPILARAPSAFERLYKWARWSPANGLLAPSIEASLPNSTRALTSTTPGSPFDTTTTQAMARDAELRSFEAERKAAEVLQLSLLQDYEDLVSEAKDLWPILPEEIGALHGWLKRANQLTGELPGLIAKRDELRKLAVPRSQLEARVERESHPEYEAIAPLRAEIKARRIALAVRRGDREVRLPSPNWNDYPRNASRLIEIAWPLMAPARTAFGQEALGLVLAKRAAKIVSNSSRASILNNVAWGWFALGDFDHAIEASREATRAASAAERGEYESNLTSIESAVRHAVSHEGLEAEEVALTEKMTQLRALEIRVNQRRRWVFPSGLTCEPRARWLHNQVSNLVGRLNSLTELSTGLLSEHGVSEQHGLSINHRLRLAERLRHGFECNGEFERRWRESQTAIAATYPGLNLIPQMGLVPIGRDPDSQLWEFWHIVSGTEPKRGPDGRLQLEANSGLVFVLLAADEFWMGAQSNNPRGRNFDSAAWNAEGPVHSVRLSAFFLSKYEMTQGQWQRLSGKNPSRYDPTISLLNHRHDLIHPVEEVSWHDCMALLPRVGLALPSEAQWEYGARAKTSTVWWTGNERESLQARRAGNFADRSAARAGASWAEIRDWPELDGGYAVHAPVDEFAPNAFGLHNVHGNVWEWCLDLYDDTFYERSRLKDPLNIPGGSESRVIRGGSFHNTVTFARSSHRSFNTESYAFTNLGVRPACRVSYKHVSPRTCAVRPS